MTFANLVIGVLGSVLLAGTFAWMFDWGWEVALLSAAIFIAVDIGIGWVRTRNSAKLRRRYLLRGMKPPDERSISFQANAGSAESLWFAELASLLLVACGIFVLAAVPEKWAFALAGIGFFGFSAAFNAYLLLVRYGWIKARGPAPAPTIERKEGEPS